MEMAAIIWSVVGAVGKTLGGAVGAWLAHRKPEIADDHISVDVIADVASDKIHAALALFGRRLPERVQFPPDDIVRWLKDDQLRRQRGVNGPRHYFLLASSKGVPCGCTLIHSFRDLNLAFIAYLASDDNIPYNGSITNSLFKKFKELSKSDKHLVSYL